MAQRLLRASGMTTTGDFVASRRSASHVNKALAAALLLLGSCAVPPTMTEARIARIDQAVGASQQSRSKYLRYAVDSDEGTWTREIVIAPGAYAEQRTRRTDGTRYAFGRDAQGAWLRIGDGEVIDQRDGTWEQEARTDAGLFGL